jgi:biotin carboxyl carrier protein
MKKIKTLLIIALLLILAYSCGQKSTTEREVIPVVSVITESVASGNIDNQISFSGKSVYLKKNLVVSPIAGYIVKAEAGFGDQVRRDVVLYEIQTKESKALQAENTVPDSFGFIKVVAPSGGFINEIAVNETGGFVAEGATLCTIVDNEDIMVQLNVPFEYNSMIKPGKNCKILLPDNSVLNGVVYKVLQVVDEANQTQSVLIKPNRQRQLPENLNMTIQFVKESHLNTNLVSRTSLMTNETQSEFWVMKIINDTLAVKIPVIKGFENDTVSEVSSPLLKINDLVISVGAYGLPDSTVVKTDK